MQLAGTIVKLALIVDSVDVREWEDLEQVSEQDVLALVQRHFPIASLPDYLELADTKAEKDSKDTSLWRVGITVRFKESPPHDVIARILQQEHVHELLTDENALTCLIVEEALQPFDYPMCPFGPEHITVE